MSLSPLDSALYGPLFTTPELRELFSDRNHVARMVQVEVALARAQAGLGLIPAVAADEIAAGAQGFEPDLAALSAGLMADGVPVVALLAQLRPRLGEAGREFLHFGATTQDVVDTALVLALRGALNHLEADLHGVLAGLMGLADRHRHALMAGRTHSQQALPITFGLKAATWLAPLTRHVQRLAELRPRVLNVQFGGAAGTLAALGGDGLRVQAALAAELGLAEALTPWHTARDTLGELAAWLSLLTGSLGKLAQDVLLLAQSEVAELRESREARGGSSTMPQKQNPVLCEGVLAAARLNATLLSAVHHAAIQEHERGTHGWQLEWLTLPQMLGLSAGALSRVRTLVSELDVDTGRMAQNVADSRGLMLAEAYTLALSPALGREGAKDRVRTAVAQVVQTGGTLAGALEPLPAGLTLPAEADYLGMTQTLIDRVLRAAEHALTTEHVLNRRSTP